MSGSGHMQELNRRMRENRAARPSKRDKFKSKNREAIYSGNNKTKTPAKFKKVTAAELSEIKQQIKIKSKADKKKEILIISIIGIFVFAALIIGGIWLNERNLFMFR